MKKIILTNNKNTNPEYSELHNEPEESKKVLLRDLIDGRILTRYIVVKQLPYILFLTFLAIIYIGNRYHAEKVVRETTNLQERLEELRSDAISIESKLFNLSKQSNVSKEIKKRGLELYESIVPPKRIK